MRANIAHSTFTSFNVYFLLIKLEICTSRTRGRALINNHFWRAGVRLRWLLSAGDDGDDDGYGTRCTRLRWSGAEPHTYYICKTMLCELAPNNGYLWNEAHQGRGPQVHHFVVSPYSPKNYAFVGIQLICFFLAFSLLCQNGTTIRFIWFVQSFGHYSISNAGRMRHINSSGYILHFSGSEDGNCPDDEWCDSKICVSFVYMFNSIQISSRNIPTPTSHTIQSIQSSTNPCNE